MKQQELIIIFWFVIVVISLCVKYRIDERSNNQFYFPKSKNLCPVSSLNTNHFWKKIGINLFLDHENLII